MRRADPIQKPSPADQRTDRNLLTSVVLAPSAAFLNTLIGFTVAHWVDVSDRKTTGYLVSLFNFALCLVAAFLAWGVYQQMGQADETVPETGRRLFMAKMGLMLAGFAAMVVLAGTLVMITLHPAD